MMVISSIILFVAVFLDGIISTASGYLHSNFMIVTLLLIYPLFLEKKPLYVLLLVCSTILYDSLYTNIFLFHTTCMLCIYLWIEKSIKTVDWTYILGYFLLYHIIVFSLLYIIGYITNPLLLIEYLISGSICNILYTIGLYYLLKNYYPKRKIKFSS